MKRPTTAAVSEVVSRILRRTVKDIVNKLPLDEVEAYEYANSVPCTSVAQKQFLAVRSDCRDKLFSDHWFGSRCPCELVGASSIWAIFAI